MPLQMFEILWDQCTDKVELGGSGSILILLLVFMLPLQVHVGKKSLCVPSPQVTSWLS